MYYKVNVSYGICVEAKDKWEAEDKAMEQMFDVKPVEMNYDGVALSDKEVKELGLE